MRIWFILFCFAINVLSCFSQYASKNLINKAQEAFDMQKWKSAATLYNLVVQDSSCYTPLAAKAIISDFLADDSAGVIRAKGLVFKYSDDVIRLMDDVSKLSVQIREFDVYEPVVDTVEEMLPHKKDSLRLSLIRFYLFLKQSDDVVRLCDKYIAEEPDNVNWYNMKAKAYMSRGEADKARDIYVHILTLSPYDYEANTFLGNYYYIKTKYEISALEKAMTGDESLNEDLYSDYFVRREDIIDGDLTLAVKYLSQAKAIKDNERINISLLDLEHMLNNDPFMDRLRKRSRR